MMRSSWSHWVAERPEQHLTCACGGVVGQGLRAVLGGPDGQVPQCGGIAAQRRREHLDEQVLGFISGLGHVEPGRGHGVGERARLAAVAPQVTIEEGTRLGVLRRRRVVRRRQPAVRHRQGGGDPPVGAPGPQPDLRGWLGQRCQLGDARVEPTGLGRLTADQGRHAVHGLVEAGPPFLERHPHGVVVHAARARAQARDDGTFGEDRQRGQGLGDHDRVTHDRQRDAGREDHVPGGRGHGGQSGGAVEPRVAPEEVVVGRDGREAQVAGLAHVRRQLGEGEQAVAPVGQRQMDSQPHDYLRHHRTTGTSTTSRKSPS